MSIWGKVLGAAAGFALGGPLGALIGGFAGHAVDRMSGTPAEQSGARLASRSEERQIAFTIAVITLSAKMAKADGVVKREEIDAFKRIFHIPRHEMKNVAGVWDRARRDSAGYEPYAAQIGRMFRGEPRVLEELLAALFQIARADGDYHPAERDYLQNVARIFGLSQQDFERIEAEQVGPQQGDPYAILGVARSAKVAEIKAAYRKLIRENHPDKLVAEGMPKEFIEHANERMATINAAYDRVRKQRGFS